MAILWRKMACLAAIGKGKMKNVEFDSSADLINKTWLEKNMRHLYPPVCQAIYQGDAYYFEFLYDHAVGEYVKATAIGRFYFLADSESSSAAEGGLGLVTNSSHSRRKQSSSNRDTSSSHHRRRKFPVETTTSTSSPLDPKKSLATNQGTTTLQKLLSNSSQIKSSTEDQEGTSTVVTSKSTIRRKAKEWHKIIPSSLKPTKRQQQQPPPPPTETKTTTKTTKPPQQLEGASLQSQRALSELKRSYSGRTSQAEGEKEEGVSRTELIRRSSGSTRSGSRRSIESSSRVIPANWHKLPTKNSSRLSGSLLNTSNEETKAMSEPKLPSRRPPAPPTSGRRRPKSTPTRLGTRHRGVGESSLSKQQRQQQQQHDPYTLLGSSSHLSFVVEEEEASEEGELEEFLNKIMQDESIRAATQDLLQTPVGKKAIRSVKNKALGLISTFRKNHPPPIAVGSAADTTKSSASSSLEKKLGKKLSSERASRQPNKFSSSVTTTSTSDNSLETFLRQTSKVVAELEDQEPSLVELLSHVQSIASVLQKQTLLVRSLMEDGGYASSAEVEPWSDDDDNELDATIVQSYTTNGIANHIEALLDSCDKIIEKVLTRMERHKGGRNKRALNEYKKTFALEKAFIDQLRRGFLDSGKKGASSATLLSSTRKDF